MPEDNNDTSLLGEFKEEDLKKPEDENPNGEIELRPKEESKLDTIAENQEKKLTKPDDLPDDLWNEDLGNFDSMKLYEQYNHEKKKALGLRQALSRGQQKAPENPEGYELNIEELQQSTNLEFKDDDAGLKAAREAAFESGLSKAQFESFVGKYMKGVVDSGVLEKAKESAVELSKEEKAEQHKVFAEQELKKLGENAPKIVNSIKNWGQQQVHKGVFSEDDYKAFLDMGYDAKSIRVLNLLREANGDLSIPDNLEAMEGLPSREEIDRIIASPDYESDRVKQRKVTEYFEKIHRK